MAFRGVTLDLLIRYSPRAIRLTGPKQRREATL